MEIISLADARHAGLAAYFTGKPCPKGHVGPRRVVNRACSICNDVATKSAAKNRYSDPEYASKIRAKAAQWAKDNPERYKERQKRWRKANPGAITKLVKEWSAKNPERADELRKSSSLARNMRKRHNGGAATPAELRDLRKRHKSRCANCGKKHNRMEFDHIVPVAKGGSGHVSNLQLLCSPCNRAKSAKDPVVWARENGRLI